MDYICYISQSKIDKLYAQLEPQEVLEHSESVSSTREKSGSVNGGLSVTGIIDLFKGGITYGRNEVIQRDQKLKTTYTEKLRNVLLAIEADSGDIPDIRDAISAGHGSTLYHFYSGSFQVDPLSNPPKIQDVVTISSRAGSYQLELDCSIRYFSESAGDEGQFVVHSGNSAFFFGRVRLNFETVFILLDMSGHRVLGTPLYLKLTVPSFSHHSL